MVYPPTGGIVKGVIERCFDVDERKTCCSGLCAQIARVQNTDAKFRIFRRNIERLQVTLSYSLPKEYLFHSSTLGYTSRKFRKSAGTI